MDGEEAACAYILKKIGVLAECLYYEGRSPDRLSVSVRTVSVKGGTAYEHCVTVREGERGTEKSFRFTAGVNAEDRIGDYIVEHESELPFGRAHDDHPYTPEEAAALMGDGYRYLGPAGWILYDSVYRAVYRIAKGQGGYVGELSCWRGGHVRLENEELEGLHGRLCGRLVKRLLANP